jgi:predicted transcriptional regulator of viral defense system
MKRISLTEDELESLETALIEFGSVVTFDQLSSLFQEDRQYTRKRISKLVKQGWLKRIKKGVFVISDFSSRGTLPFSHLAVVNILVEEAYISFESALQYHGLYDQLLHQVNAISLSSYKTTTIDSITYKFIKTQTRYFYGWETHDINGQTIKIAIVEKALIDLLQFHRSLYSTDVVLEKLYTFQNDVQYERLVAYTLKANLTTRRIMGLLMDIAGMDSDKLHASVLKRQSVSSISHSENSLYNHKWKLYYDPHLEKHFHE